ncbi:PH domain-containing protein [Candidatus Microgenomates bacterium]|nr:PH domain-containing protein [Candidatus Microgenomates bacterium]
MPDIFVAQPPSLSKETEEEKPLEKKPVNNFASTPPLSAFMLHPKGVCFKNQDPDEEVLILLRRHWVTNVPWITFGIFMFLVPAILTLVNVFLGINFDISSSTIWIARIFWYLVTFGYLLINFLIWYFNVHLVTNERLVDIDFHNLLYKEVSSAQLDKIQAVTFKMGGVVRHIFNYGDVFIQTAGTEPNFDFLAVPKPAMVSDKIGEILEELGKNKP